MYFLVPDILYGAQPGIVALFKMGKIWMWILLLVSIIALAYILERFYFFIKIKPFSSDLFLKVSKLNSLSELKNILKKEKTLVARILYESLNNSDTREKFEDKIERLTNVYVNELGKGLNILATIGSIAPLIGFLGTVAGMISAFSSIASADNVSPRLVASGIYTALITTAAGLIIAIPSIAMYNFFVHKIDNFISEIEKIVNIIISKDFFNEDKNKT